MEREPLDKDEATVEELPTVVPRGKIEVKDDFYRTTFVGNYCCCHGTHLLSVSDKHSVRRVHWRVCMNRCVAGRDYYETCECFMALIENKFDGVIPNVRARLPKPGSPGFILDKY